MRFEQAREAAAAATRTRLAATRHLADATHAVEQGELTNALQAASAAYELLPDDPEVLRVRKLVEGRAAEEARRREEEAAAHAAIEKARALAASGQLLNAIRDLESFRPLDLVEAVLEDLQIERLRLDEAHRQEETRKADEERRLMAERRAEAERRFEERRRREQERRRESRTARRRAAAFSRAASAGGPTHHAEAGASRRRRLTRLWRPRADQARGDSRWPRGVDEPAARGVHGRVGSQGPADP